MENKYYQLYIDSIFRLAGSVVIKCHNAALTINQQAYNNYGSYDENDLTTWKYYKNISGEYFNTDTVMTIVSIDSLEEIVFSKETLRFHAATKKAYAFDTTYYKELVDLYPDQEQLIRGILYPVDIHEAIAAPDYTILAYPGELVEATEPSLIPQLQEFIDGYYLRWENLQYQNTDDLYRAAFMGVLYASLPGAIENIRKRACFTYEAHNYHVKQYLASHSQLDKYLPYMTRSQAMFFYHNISFIEKNNGKQEIFDKLLKRIFTDRKLPVGHFSLRHSTEEMPDNLVPLVVFDKKPLNTLKNIDGIDQYTLDQVFDIEDVLLANNIRYRDNEQRLASVLLANTHAPNLPTKLLQSTVIDDSGSEHFKLGDIALNHWVWLSHRDLYNAFITVTIPATGGKVSLNAKDAFSFYAYALCKGLNLVLDKLPTVAANRVQCLPTASIASMRAVCQPQHVTDDWLISVRNLMPTAVGMISVESFKEHIDQLFIAANEQYARVCFEEKLTSRAQKEAASTRLYCTELLYCGDYPEQTYQSWFEERNIVLDELTVDQYYELSTAILSEAIGSNLASVITLRDIQRAMASMFLDLSSYSIQMGLNINSGPMIDAGIHAIRLDDPDISTEGSQYFRVPVAVPLDIKVRVDDTRYWDITKFTQFDIEYSPVTAEYTYALKPVSLGLQENNKAEFPVITIERQYAIGVHYDCEMDTSLPNPRKLTLVPGMEHFLALPLEVQLASYVDTWAK